MAIAHRATGSGSASSNTQSFAIPAAQVTGDMMLLIVVGKPFDSGMSVATAGWASLGSFAPGTTAAGTDLGSMKAQVWWKEATSDAETNPTLDESATLWNVVGGLVVVFSKDVGDAWATPVFVGGGDDDNGTAVSLVCNSNPGIVTGDHCVSFFGAGSDASTPCSSHVTPTATGVTFTNTHDPATDFETIAGGDMGMCVTRSTVSGTASAAPVLTATLAAAGRTAGGLVRLRVGAALPTNYTLDATVANITYTGGTHSLVYGRGLSATVANVDYLGGAHTLTYTPGTPGPTAYTLDALVANVDYAGGAHTLTFARNLVAGVADITYAGGAHVLTFSRSLAASVANVDYVGGDHTLTFGRLLTAGVADVAYAGGDHILTYTPGSPTVNYTLAGLVADITYAGGSHVLTYTGAGRDDWHLYADVDTTDWHITEDTHDADWHITEDTHDADWHVDADGPRSDHHR